MDYMAEIEDKLDKILERLPSKEEENETEELTKERDKYYGLYKTRNESMNFYHGQYVAMIALYEQEKQKAEELEEKLKLLDHA